MLQITLRWICPDSKVMETASGKVENSELEIAPGECQSELTGSDYRWREVPIGIARCSNLHCPQY